MNFEFHIPIALIVGWLLDFFFGDPEQLPHPVVGFGKWIAFGEKKWNNGSERKAHGALFAVSSILAVFILSSLILFFIPAPISTFIETVLIFFCLAGHTLRKEVRMVFEAVDRSVEEGRTQVGRIVGRDTSQLDAQEIRTAALETLAENLSDGVIAPLFWYLIFGVPGMLTYKMINTLDSMIGYQNARYKDFGCWAAKIDDFANFIPARITAFLMIIVAWICGKASKSQTSRKLSLKEMFAFVCKYGPQHASPNSGWPEAALACILDCRFGGPHNYFGEYFYKPFIGTNPRQLNTADMQLSISNVLISEIIFVAFIAIIRMIIL